MSTKIFEERLKRIAHHGPSGKTIPGQVGDVTPNQVKKVERERRVRHRTKRKETVVTSLLFGGILGAIVGLVFQHVVGVQVFLDFNWEVEWAIMQRDMVRAGVWGAIAAGATLSFISLLMHQKLRKVAAWSTTYMISAVGVNAEDLLALMPPAA